VSKSCDAGFSKALLIESPKRRPPQDGFRRNEVDNGGYVVKQILMRCREVMEGGKVSVEVERWVRVVLIQADCILLVVKLCNELVGTKLVYSAVNRHLSMW